MHMSDIWGMGDSNSWGWMSWGPSGISLTLCDHCTRRLPQKWTSHRAADRSQSKFPREPGRCYLAFSNQPQKSENIASITSCSRRLTPVQGEGTQTPPPDEEGSKDSVTFLSHCTGSVRGTSGLGKTALSASPTGMRS